MSHSTLGSFSALPGGLDAFILDLCWLTQIENGPVALYILARWKAVECGWSV